VSFARLSADGCSDVKYIMISTVAESNLTTGEPNRIEMARPLVLHSGGATS
jgi:hypothetical protein